MSNLHEIYTHLLFFGVGVIVATVWIYKRSRTMRKNPEEKFIEERLKHEKSERDLFEQLQKLIAENKELKEMMFVAESALMKQNKAYRKCIAEILEQVQDAINEKCNRPCEECTGRVLCDNYFIVNKIKELNNV